MNILLLGGGGREHAMSWSLSQNADCEKLYIAPGNAGTRQLGENVDLKEDDFDAIKNLVLKEDIDLVIPGQEKPLVKRIVDFFKKDGE